MHGQNKFYLNPDFMLDARMQSLSKTNQWHFIHLIALWHDGIFEQHFRDDEVRDKVAAKALGISNAACRRVKHKLFAAQLMDGQWQPLAEGELWISLDNVGKYIAQQHNGGNDL